MSRFKKMWIAFGNIMVLGLLFYLVLSRNINPDRYFLLKTDKIPFREIMINVSRYAMEFEPQFKRGSYKLGLGRSVDIDKLYTVPFGVWIPGRCFRPVHFEKFRHR